MVATSEELQRLSDTVWERTWHRLGGLTDDEYCWEPVPGCWSIRERSNGTPFGEWAPIVYPDPFTTLAWRLWHLIDMYGEDRAPKWLGVEPQGEPIGPDAADSTPPTTAAEALDQLDRAHTRWDAHLALVDDERLGTVIGPIGGEHGDGTRAGYVLHMLDEFIHHGAEIALLRDLYRWQRPVSTDEFTERAIRGDHSLLVDIQRSRDRLRATQHGRHLRAVGTRRGDGRPWRQSCPYGTDTGARRRRGRGSSKFSASWSIAALISQRGTRTSVPRH